jgi:hypothetical protein
MILPLAGEGDRARSAWWRGIPLFESVTPLRQPLRGCHLPLQGRIANVPLN